MRREVVLKLMGECGDAVINYRSPNSRKQKYNVGTTDFSTPYIQNKPRKAKETEDTILFFCWDTDSFRLLRPENIVSIQGLSTILRND